MIILLLAFDTEEKNKFRVIYRNYAEYMLCAARRILHDSSDAEDVVQDVFHYITDHFEKTDFSD